MFRLSPAQLSQFASLSPPSPPSHSILAAPTLSFAPEPGAYELVDDIGTYPHIHRDIYERLPKIWRPSCVRYGEKW
jgi:hypothetical protein